MIQNLHDKLQGWLAWIVVAVIGLSFALWGVAGFVHGQHDGLVVAKVNGKIINQNQVNALYERTRQQAKMQLGAEFEFDKNMAKVIKAAALKEIITGEVLRQAAFEQGLRVPQATLNAFVMQHPQFQQDGHFSQALFRATLARFRYSEAAFLRDTYDSILLNQIRNAIVDSSFSLSSQTQHLLRILNQARDFRLLTIKDDKFADTITVTEEERQAYYKAHPLVFQTQERVKLDYLILSLASLQDAQRIKFEQDQQKIQQYYASHRQNFTTSARWRVAYLALNVPAVADAAVVHASQQKITELAQKIKQGASFQDLVKQHSDDVISARQEGRLPWITESSQIDKLLKQAVMRLHKPGEVSAPIRTESGFALVKLIDYDEPVAQPLAKVKAKIIKVLATQVAQQQFASQREHLSEYSFANPDSLKVASQVLKLPVQKTEWITRKGGKPSLTLNPKVLAAAFSHDVLDQGNNSDVIELAQDKVMVLRVDEHQTVQPIPYSQAKTKLDSLSNNKKCMSKLKP